MKSLVSTDWASAVEGAARSAAAVLVAVYVAGLHTGELIHAANDQLAAAYRCLLVGAHRAAHVAEQVTEQVAATWQELPLQCFSVIELRSRARELGIRSVGGRQAKAQARTRLLSRVHSRASSGVSLPWERSF